MTFGSDGRKFHFTLRRRANRFSHEAREHCFPLGCVPRRPPEILLIFPRTRHITHFVASYIIEIKANADMEETFYTFVIYLMIIKHITMKQQKHLYVAPRLK